MSFKTFTSQIGRWHTTSMPKTVTYHRSRHLDGREVRSPYTKNHCRRWWWSMSKELEAVSANAPEWRDLSGRNYAGRVKPIQPVCCPTRFYRARVGPGKSQQCLSFLYSFMLRTANKPSLERKKKLVQSLQIQKKKKILVRFLRLFGFNFDLSGLNLKALDQGFFLCGTKP